MKRILIIPADSIRNEMSRSYYFAKFLTNHYEVFQLRWHDVQSLSFENKRKSKAKTFFYWIRSLFETVRVEKHPIDKHSWVWIPFMSHMIIYRLIGIDAANKFARIFNKSVLKKVVKRINPDVIFFADGFERFPSIETEALIISDVQDDIDETNFKYSKYHQQYGHRNFNLSRLNYIVSKAAAKRLGEYYQTCFTYLPNGADFEAMLSISPIERETVRSKMNLNGKYIVSFIGGDVWFDRNLACDLFKTASENDSNVHFIVVGNVNNHSLDLTNVTFIGAVDNKDSYYYYNLSDVGVLLKSSEGSPFLYNSMPLKIIQYSCLGKAVISPPLAWLNEDNYSNVSVVEPFNSKRIWDAIVEIKNTPLKSDDKWDDFNWKNIVKSMIIDIEEKTK